MHSQDTRIFRSIFGATDAGKEEEEQYLREEGSNSGSRHPRSDRPTDRPASERWNTGAASAFARSAKVHLSRLRLARSRVRRRRRRHAPATERSRNNSQNGGIFTCRYCFRIADEKAKLVQFAPKIRKILIDFRGYTYARSGVHSSRSRSAPPPARDYGETAKIQPPAAGLIRREGQSK